MIVMNPYLAYLVWLVKVDICKLTYNVHCLANLLLICNFHCSIFEPLMSIFLTSYKVVWANLCVRSHIGWGGE